LLGILAAMKHDWREWTLDRGVQAPVVFIGQLMACHDGIGATSLWNSLVGGGRWHVLSVFLTPENRYVVYIVYRTKAKGELDNREVFWCDHAPDIAHIFSQYQSVALPIIAERMLLPPDKKSRAALDVTARFQRQVATVLAAIPAASVKLV
jgi:hypothetical protein